MQTKEQSDTTNALMELHDLLRVGDALLSACRDPLSKIIRIGSRSGFSHAVIVTGRDQLTEAYDHGMTPGEDDDGIYQLTISDYVHRTGLQRVLVRRPTVIDRRRVEEVAEHLQQHSPGFPTVGMLCLALCGLSAPVLRLLPEKLEHRFTVRQIRQAADGTRRMHCAETLTRIYYASGVPLRFNSPRLAHHIKHLGGAQITEDPSRLPNLPRSADPGQWPGTDNRWKAAIQLTYCLRALCETWHERATAEDPVDLADLVLPGDFVTAWPFETVAEFRKTGNRWVKVAG